MKKTIDGDRLVAFLIVDGKVYSSDCDHQECLELYYKDKGIKSEFDYTLTGEDYDNEKAKAIEKTYEMKNSHEAYGFDLFDTGDEYILLGHDKETLEKNLDWAKKYQKENVGIEIGYFTHGYNAEVLERTA